MSNDIYFNWLLVGIVAGSTISIKQDVCSFKVLNMINPIVKKLDFIHRPVQYFVKRKKRESDAKALEWIKLVPLENDGTENNITSLSEMIQNFNKLYEKISGAVMRASSLNSHGTFDNAPKQKKRKLNIQALSNKNRMIHASNIPYNFARAEAENDSDMKNFASSASEGVTMRFRARKRVVVYADD